MKIPKQLQDTEFRFYLIVKNSKLPLENRWNSVRNYGYDHPILETYTGNLGVVCGHGGLVVVDFDDKLYYDSVKNSLPATFTVITAGKRLPHLYYRLTDWPEQGLKKVKIDHPVTKARMCDVQMSRCGVVAPGSVIDRRRYEPNELSIYEINLKALLSALRVKSEPEQCRAVEHNNLPKNSLKMRLAYAVLKLCDVKVNYNGLMKCPFHPMSGKGNLSVLPSGKIYCFHEELHWWPDEFLRDCKNVPMHEVHSIIKNINEGLKGADKDGS